MPTKEETSKYQKFKSLDQVNHIRFLGAGGIGMSALIKVLEDLKSLGKLSASLKISKMDGAWTENDPLTPDVDLAVVSTAIPKDNSDYIYLADRGTPIWHRSDMLRALSEFSKQKVVVVTGTHGKTTCSAMVSHIYEACSKDPSFVVGGILSNYSSNGKAGKGDYFILEGDESDKSYQNTSPDIAFLTSAEPDHLENYPGGFNEIKSCFKDFISDTEYVVVCQDDPTANSITKEVKAQREIVMDGSSAMPMSHGIVTYSAKDKSADFYLDQESREVFYHGESQGILRQEMFGDYSYLNALGSIACANLGGIEIKDAISAMASFKGIKRRLEFIGDFNIDGKNVKIFDDYAHHPTEVKALLEGILREKPKRLVFVYQPHHPRRTQDLWKEFVDVFKDFPAEHLAMIADIYVARTPHIEGITSEKLVAEINNSAVKYLPFANAKFDSKDDDVINQAKEKITAELQDGDLLFIVGAGNVTKVAQAF